MPDTFKRHEKKYILNTSQYNKLQELISHNMRKDKFCEDSPYLIRNIYLDTFNSDLIRMSCDKPIYKEKLRIRKYGDYNDGIDKYYIEIKRKYMGIVYKRRVALKKDELHNFTTKGIIPKNKSPQEVQILNEIKYLFNIYSPIPKSFIAYKRIAYYEIGNPDFRLTFDTDLYSRHDDFSFDNDYHEMPLLDNGYYLMEVKVGDSMPKWFASILSEIKAIPGSFSKYGTDFKISTRKDKTL